MIVGCDQNTNVGTAGTYNGRVYRVGNQRLDINSAGTTWELLPGEDFAIVNGVGLSATAWDVWIVGKGTDPTTGAYTGAVQDTGLFTTFIAPK